MHDIGKIGIPDGILLKPGELTPEERRSMQEHGMIGYRILEGSDSALIQIAASIAISHHERFDGGGYPHGLSGDDLPLEGRVAAIADVFDALTTDRVYRRAYPLGRAVELMVEGRGTQFDPVLLDTFLDAMDEVLAIYEDLSD
jgi:putative two-component system response regulator